MLKRSLAGFGRQRAGVVPPAFVGHKVARDKAVLGEALSMALLFYSKVDDPVEWAAALKRAEPSLDVRVWPDLGDVADINGALVWRPPTGLLAGLPNLKVVFSLGAGVDHVFADAELPASVPVVRLVDPALTSQMVEYVLLAVLHHHRRMDDYEACRVGVMGLGEIGAAAARALAGLGFSVAGWSRTPKSLDSIESFHGADGFLPFLAESNVVVCLLPLTPETTGILDARAFAAMPKGAYVVSAGRGAHLVENDLVAALDSGHLSGAWLDVCQTEPLPPDSPLWRQKHVTITPHIAGWVLPRTASVQVIDNLRRVLAGDPPLNIVDPARGY
jgi:glyoxylate/hydroxypyruvate reductase A